MTMRRTGDAWMPADEYGRGMPRFSVNLLVRDVAKSLPFYVSVLGATVKYSDADFAAMVLNGVEFMLHPITPTITIRFRRDCKVAESAEMARSSA